MPGTLDFVKPVLMAEDRVLTGAIHVVKNQKQDKLKSVNRALHWGGKQTERQQSIV